MPRGETISVTMDADTLRAVRERREEAAHLDSIRARIRRSLDDPRPPSSIEELQDEMENLFAAARRERPPR